MSSSGKWGKRSGYAGPASFSPEATAQFSVKPSDALDGTAHSLILSDGRQLDVRFERGRVFGLFGTPNTVAYEAREPVPGIFYVHVLPKGNDRHCIAIALNLASRRCVLIEMVVPSEEDADSRVRKAHINGVIEGGNATLDAPAVADLVGKRFVAEYSDKYAWEIIYMSDTLVAWHGLKGNPGIADIEEYQATFLAPGVTVVSWSEKAEALSLSLLYDFNRLTITGHMFGYAPENSRILHMKMGGRIRAYEDFRLAAHPCGTEEKEANVSAVMRQHQQVWNEANYDLIDELYTKDFTSLFVGNVERQGRDAMKEFIRGHRRSFPDWYEEVITAVADGKFVATLYRSTGTHMGFFEGIAPTGRRVTIDEISLYELKNGQILRQWGFPDAVALIRQIT